MWYAARTGGLPRGLAGGVGKPFRAALLVMTHRCSMNATFKNDMKQVNPSQSYGRSQSAFEFTGCRPQRQIPNTATFKQLSAM
ncbi:hypothetical protein DIPPA_06850 [Diplonema papillatum]|nr:hypothetical protein DIPPA_06850 [Diplonema papillatum]